MNHHIAYDDNIVHTVKHCNDRESIVIIIVQKFVWNLHNSVVLQLVPY